MLARTFTDELIDEAGEREKRLRLLPARLMVLFTLACWLFTRAGYVGVLAKLADAHLIEGVRGWSVPGTEAIGRARERLGPARLRLLFAKDAGPLGQQTKRDARQGRVRPAAFAAVLDTGGRPARTA